MDWQEWRKNTADDQNRGGSSGGGRRFDPWQAKNMQVAAGDDFEVLICDRPPHVRPHHWVNKLPHECTRHIAMFDGKCVFCVDAERLDAENQILEAAGKQPIEFRHRQKSQFVLPLIDMRMHHFIPDADKPGKFTTAACAYPEFQVTPGGPQGLCPHCKSSDPYVATRRFLGIRRWEVDEYGDLWKALKDADRQAAGTCLHTYEDGSVCGGKTWIASIICPECGHEHMDSEAAHVKMQDTVSFYENLQECPSCKAKRKPYVVYGCHNSAKRGKGGIPEHDTVPGSLVSGSLHIHCYGESKTKNGETRTIRKFNVTPFPMRDRVEAAMAFGYDEAEATKLLNAEGLDLDEAYVPESFKIKPRSDKYMKGGTFDATSYVADVLQEQAEVLGVTNPFTGKSTTTNRPFQGGSRRTYVPEGEGAGRKD